MTMSYIKRYIQVYNIELSVFATDIKILPSSPGAFDLEINSDRIERHIICRPGLRCAAHPLIDQSGEKYRSSLPDSIQHMKEIGEDPVGG